MDSQKVFIVFFAIFAASVLSKPFTIDIFENNDSILGKSAELVKRKASIDGLSNDVAELSVPKISLSALIDNIENGLLKTALSASHVANEPNVNIPDIPTSQTTASKQTVANDAPVSSEEVTTSRPVDRGSIVTVANINNNPTILAQTSEKILANEVRPSHVVIDRVSVYSAPFGSSLFPTFHLKQHTNQVIAEIEKDTPQLIERPAFKRSTDTSSSESDEHLEPTVPLEYEESSESSEEITKVTKLKRVAPVVGTSSISTSTTTDVPSSPVTSSAISSSSTQSTTPNDKQKVEKQLKVKVAEVEAEPVIMSARV